MHVDAVEIRGESIIKFAFHGTHEEQAALLKALVDRGHEVFEFREQQADLEDVFMQLTTGALN
jgi:hypothetical protein